MACDCKKKQQTAEKKPVEEARPYTVTIAVRSVGQPLACENCLLKHLASAAINSIEYGEDAGRVTERALASANLSCAVDHARALGKDELVKQIEAANASNPQSVFDLLPNRGSEPELAIGNLAAAEVHLRISGDPASADKVREIRLAFQSKALGGDGGREIVKEPAGGPSEGMEKTLESRQVASVNTDPTEG